MQVEQELVPVQGLHSLVARDKGLHNRAEGLSPARTHHSAEGGILSACQAELEAAAGAREGLVGPVDPVVLEAGGCSEPWK